MFLRQMSNLSVSYIDIQYEIICYGYLKWSGHKIGTAQIPRPWIDTVTDVC